MLLLNAPHLASNRGRATRAAAGLQALVLSLPTLLLIVAGLTSQRNKIPTLDPLIWRRFSVFHTRTFQIYLIIFSKIVIKEEKVFLIIHVSSTNSFMCLLPVTAYIHICMFLNQII